MALYVWGSNATQQLGLDVDAEQVFDVMPVEALGGEVLVDFSAGVNHSLAVNEFGDVFAWGRGREGQLGLSQHKHQIVRVPERVTALDGQIITKVSCGDAHSIALSIAGDVFMWGLLPETREVKNDGMFDSASVSLTGLQTPARLREGASSSSSDIMARLVRGSEEIYEALNLTKHDVDDTETSLDYLNQKKVQTVRHPCFTPRQSISLSHHKIINIAAGFAHSLAVSAEGIVFSCGYNDNGQLGLGSRRNAADFQRVKGLDGYFITDIACGQQHSMACSRFDPLSPKKSGICFSWGLGILGQLGLGINISWLPMEVNIDKPVVSIAAGSHHSVAVTVEGKVYTWGHSEYGQHGVGERFADLQRGLYFFFPRVQEYLESEGIVAERATCSSHSTFVLTRDGSVYSWGWNAFGVLGNGKFQPSVHPQRITGLKDNIALHVSAGSNHCAVIVRPRGCHYSLKYDEVLRSQRFSDLSFIVGREKHSIGAHQVIVSARSGYLRGLLRVLRTDQQGCQPLIVEEFSDIDPQVFRSFLLYLYTSRVEIASHKRQALMGLAERVFLDELAEECQASWKKERSALVTDELPELCGFEEDMLQVVLSSEFSDVVFLWPIGEDTNPRDEETKEGDGGVEFVRLPAHKAILSQVDYFHTMFAGGFSEGQSDGARANNCHEIPLHHMPQDGISLAAFKALLSWIYTGSVPLLRRLEPSAMMDLYVAASLMSLKILAHQCEMLLISLIPRIELDNESLQACLDFAQQFDARRLQNVCIRAMEHSTV